MSQDNGISHSLLRHIQGGLQAAREFFHLNSSQHTNLGSLAKTKITDEGGLAILLTNKSGVATIKGTTVQASVNYDGAFEIAEANCKAPIGFMYEDGVVDGQDSWVVVSGIAEVLLKDSTATVRGNWMVTSDVAGRIDGTATAPPGGTLQAAETHFDEIGHSLQSASAGTDVLVSCVIHFN